MKKIENEIENERERIYFILLPSRASVAASGSY